MIKFFYCFVVSVMGVLYNTCAHAALYLQLDRQSLTAAQQLATQQLLKQAKATLPPLFVQQLDHVVTIRWVDHLPADVYGRTDGLYSLVLNKSLLPALTSGQAKTQKTNRAHGTLYQELLATIIHELTHLYDAAGLFNQNQVSAIRYCKRLSKAEGVDTLPLYCVGFADRHFSLSDDARFLDLAGWPLRISDAGMREDKNRRADRMPDSYELTNPKEFIAVNMEYFLLDPYYACRRPQLAQWLSDHFRWKSPIEQSCSKDYVYLYANDNFANSPLEQLDPERIYGVDYLFAAGNQEWMSRWGHSMLRLIICAPDRPRGPDCRFDLEYHRVLSYRAFVNDLQISSFKGLTGSYPSRLFILPFNQVVDEYTKLEWRPLESIPLKLSRQEVLSLVGQAVELHWSYDGSYYFISNNCAVETLKLLRTGTNRLDLQTLDTITPSGLLALLEARKLADTSVLKDKAYAMKNGYLFDSYRERYETMFKVIKQQFPMVGLTVDDWLSRPAILRRQFFKMANLRSSAALLLLEQAAIRKQTLAAYQELKEYYFKSSDQKDRALLADTNGQLAEVILHSTFLSRPATLLKQGYGLPLPDEIKQVERESLAEQKALGDVNTRLKDQLKALLPKAMVNELQYSEENMKLLGTHIHQLYKAEGGLDLKSI